MLTLELKIQPFEPVKKDIVVEAIHLIESGLQSSISVSEIGRNFEKSHWNFQRLFRSVVGLSMGNYIRLRRLTEAASLLRNTNERILDIAILFDFSSQEAFARAFKKFSGLTPSEYRENRNIVIRDTQSRLSNDRIEYFWNNVQRSPTIKTLDSFIVCGMKVDFLSHFEEGSDCAVKVVEHWKKFAQTKHLIKDHKKGELYGIALSSELELREKKLTYLAGVSTTNTDQNLTDHSFINMQGGLYALFENRGLAQKHSSLMDYIYGIWIPNSQYKRRPGYDFEIFDKRYQLDNEDSISTFCLPIEPR